MVDTMVYFKFVCCCVCILSVIATFHVADSHPLFDRLLSRQRRVSDQRLAELETLIALSKMKQKLVTVPVGFGRIDPAKLGRRRRSVQRLLQTLSEDLSSSQEQETEENSDERFDDRDLLLNILYNEQLRRRFKSLPVRYPK